MTKKLFQKQKKTLRKKIIKKNNKFRKTHRKLYKRNSNNKRRTGGSPTTPPENDFEDTAHDEPINLKEIEIESHDGTSERISNKPTEREIGNLITQNITAQRSTKKRAMNTIGKFLKNVNPDKRRAYFLNSICSDSGVCIAFGKEANTIKKHFDNFTNFKYLIGYAKTIGTHSSNGFVKELTYENQGYKAYAILKSSIESNADNLLYEAYVGNYLNRVGLQYPCFVETYGAFTYNKSNIYEDTIYEEMKDEYSTPANILYTGMTELKDINTVEQIAEACKSPQEATSLLIQYLRDAKSVNSQVRNVDFLKNELIYVLFQVYAPLALLHDKFTHYDLHTGNILLYEPVKGCYVEYHYYIKGTVISFKSKYIVKIIDYGRCFFNDDANATFSGDSKKIYEKVCLEKSCDPNCGEYMGFDFLKFFSNPRSQERNFYISSQRPNKSHDLRALNYISKMPHKYYEHMPKDLQTILQKVYYKNQDGSPESESGLPDKITTVSDALSELLIIQSEENVAKNNEHYASLKKLGDLHIYADGNLMKYESVI